VVLSVKWRDNSNAIHKRYITGFFFVLEIFFMSTEKLDCPVIEVFFVSHDKAFQNVYRMNAKARKAKAEPITTILSDLCMM
jgi:hypothetical protein